MDDEILADKSTAIPEQDWESDTYIHRKKCLVMFFSRATPNKMQAQVAARYEKKIVSIGKGSTDMAEEEVDIDIGKLHDFILSQHSSTQETMQPDFELIRNPKLNDIDEILEELSIKGNEYGSFIFIICSYLSDDGKIEVLNGSVPIDYFFDKIKSFKSMAAKPKLFLIQADDKKMTDTSITKGDPFGTRIVTKKIPTDADRIVIFSTIPQVLANKKKKAPGQQEQHTQGGKSVSQPSEEPEFKSSFLVQAFIDVLSSNPDTDLLSNTPVINGQVVELFKELGGDEVDIPVPLVTSTLTKQWFLGEKKPV